jgi:hypothetical protein
MKAYSEAAAAYRDGDYQEAAERFSAIRENTGDRRMARLALFGLTCARLMLAETPDAYVSALELWDGWIDQAPDAGNQEDARFFDPMLREKMLLSNLPPQGADAGEPAGRDTESAWILIQTKQELDRVRGQLEAAEAIGAKRQKTIRSLEKEIARLKRQIVALEAIDQGIQEKKTAIPATEKPKE